MQSRRKIARLCARVGLSLALLSLALPAVPQAIAAPAAVTFTVDTTQDLLDGDTSDGMCTPGSCSLRAAIMQANVFTGLGVTITLPSATYNLVRPPMGANGPDNGDLNLTAPASGNPIISIVGAGAASTIVDANQIDGVFAVALGRTASISGITIRGGLRIGASGGGVVNRGTLTIGDCVIADNRTDASGGGVFNTGTLHITRSTLRSNLAYLGGGLYVNNATTVRDSTVSSNGADYGGGIEVSASITPNILAIVNSTISLNYANTDGGGIDNEGNTYLYSTSVIDNDADHDRDQAGGIGGGVKTLSNKHMVVVNTLIARNTVLNAPIYDDCRGPLEVYGWNLLSDFDGCSFNGNGAAGRGMIAMDSFGPLQDNGGPTQTHALLPGSAAIDSTFAQGCIDANGVILPTDQRGAPRSVGARCDVGAFEYGAAIHTPTPSPTPSPTATQTPVPGATPTPRAKVYLPVTTK